jgi:hypothetical protein
MNRASQPHPVRGRELSAKLFADLIANSIDFFKTAIGDLEKRPKYSIINFCSGLEILLKARLFREHWSLIYKKPEEANVSRFQSGDFNSVTVDEAIRRISSILGEHFSQEEEKCFKSLRDHRNRLVHFYHETYARKASRKLLEEIAAEQCKAWFYLYRRITGPWTDVFQIHRRQIDNLNTKLHKLRIFFRGKFDALRPEIEKDVSLGTEYIVCHSCGFRSARIQEIVEPSFESLCRVCAAKDSFLRIPCPKCQELVDIDDMATASCSSEDCNEEISLSYVIEKYDPAVRTRPGDPIEPSSPYHCALCEDPEQTVIELSERYLCLMCKSWFDRVEQCEWCGTSLAGFDPDGSYLYGCFLCAQAAKEHFDRM